jgi:beta-N-acetylhexosaminidase
VIALAAAGGLAIALVQRAGNGEDPERQPGGEESFLRRLLPATEAATAEQLVRSLPLERKVGQLFLWGFRGTEASGPVIRRIQELGIGGVVLEAGNYRGPAQLKALTRGLAREMRRKRRLEPWTMVQQLGGQFSAFRDLPPERTPADTDSPRAARKEAEEAGRALASVGVNALFGPSVDVGLEDGGALGARLYSDDPEQVSAYAEATVRAYERAGILTAPSHFPGLGSATEATEMGPANVGGSLDELRRRDLPPFRAAFRAGASAVVVGSGLYTTDDFVTPASLSARILNDLLRQELGFRGVAMTDDLSDPAVTPFLSPPKAAVEALRAGADLVYVSGPPPDQKAAYDAVLKAAREKRIPPERIDEALLRTLEAKKDHDVLAPPERRRPRERKRSRESRGGAERGGGLGSG